MLVRQPKQQAGRFILVLIFVFLPENDYVFREPHRMLPHALPPEPCPKRHLDQTAQRSGDSLNEPSVLQLLKKLRNRGLPVREFVRFLPELAKLRVWSKDADQRIPGLSDKRGLH